MTSVGPSVDRVLLFTANGYVNRIQAMASSQILADQLGAELLISWIEDPSVVVDAEEVFEPKYLDRCFVADQEAKQLIGGDLSSIPLHVGVHEELGWVSLRGHGDGEQPFMAELIDTLERYSPVPLLVVVAGGTFHAVEPDANPEDTRSRFLLAKQRFYRSLPLNDAIESAAASALGTVPAPFLGLHLRYADRSDLAPNRRAIRSAALEARERTGIDRVFVASDSRPAFRYWMRELERQGMSPWSAPEGSLTPGQRALLDWRLLGNAERLIYFDGSSFGVEAAVAAGAWEESIALPPHLLRGAAIRSANPIRAGWRRILRGARR